MANPDPRSPGSIKDSYSQMGKTLLCHQCTYPVNVEESGVKYRCKKCGYEGIVGL